MRSIFRKLLHKEFGEDSYRRFFFSFQKKLMNRKMPIKIMENDDVYGELYQILKEKEIPVLERMESRLLDAMSYSVKVSRTYFWTFLFYLISALFLIALNLHPYATLPALLLMSAGFLYKTYEFVVNKYSYVDAYLILIYKAALERVIQEAGLTGESQ